MKHSEIIELEVYLYGDKVGILLLDNDGRIYFSYSSEFKTKGIQISPIKLHTDKTDSLYTNNDDKIYQGIPAIFFDSLPDKYGMGFIDRHFEAQGFKTHEITLLHRLSFIGDRGMGAIEYRPKEEDVSVKSLEDTLIIKEMYENVKNILMNKKEAYSIEALMDIIPQASPLGGARPKLLITYNKETREVKANSEVLHSGFKRYIIKFDEVYYENESIELTKFEYLYMGMAKECGINIANITLYADAGLHHLIIERFDRDKYDNKKHIATASALLHKDISVPLSVSYEELFALTNIICKKQSSVEELFRRMVFNTLSFNVDDHAKNFSFMMGKNGEWDTTPAYDITYSYGEVKEHLCTIKGKRGNFILQDYLDMAEKNLIKKDEAIKIIKQTVSVLEGLEQRAKIIGISKDAVEECVSNISTQLLKIRGDLLSIELVSTTMEDKEYTASTIIDDEQSSLVNDTRKRNQLKRLKNKTESSLSDDDMPDSYTSHKKP